MIPPELRLRRSPSVQRLAPAGTSFCAGCQSFRDDVDFGKGATTCRACTSAKTHAATVAKTYGITGDGYEALLERQGGKCAICRARPKSKRLAVDHDHKTGAVRGLLCSRCNHDLLGSAWDSLAIAVALWHYLNTPPASGAWLPPEVAPGLMPADAGKAVANAPADGDLVLTRGERVTGTASSVAFAPSVSAETPRLLPIGSEAVPGKRGVWRYLVEPDGDAPF
jgi:hypothetical protein